MFFPLAPPPKDLTKEDDGDDETDEENNQANDEFVKTVAENSNVVVFFCKYFKLHLALKIKYLSHIEFLTA